MINQKWKAPVLTLAIGFVAGYVFNDFIKNNSLNDPLTSTNAAKEISLDSANTTSPSMAVVDDNQLSTETNLVQPVAVNVLEQISEDTNIDNPRVIQNLTESVLDTSAFEDESISSYDIEIFEQQILQQLDENPSDASPLLDLYANLDKGLKKNSLRNMLAASELSVVEDRAITELINSDPSSQKQWLDMLSSTGINNAENREAMLGLISSIEDPDSIATALYSISPAVVDEYERSGIVNQLAYYLLSENPIIKSTAVEVISRWSNKGDSRFIEEAILDESIDVRYAAVNSAYIAGIRSDQIKHEMLNILDSDIEPYALKIKAFNALSTYPLDEHESNILYQFSVNTNSSDDSDESTKG